MPEPSPTQTLNYQSPRDISPFTRFLNRLPRPSLITIIILLLTAASAYWLHIDHDAWVVTRQFLGDLPRNAPKSAISPDGKQLLAILPDRQTLRIYDLPTGNTLRDLHRPAGEVTTANFSPDGTRIWSIGTDQHADLWDATTGKLLASVPVDDRYPIMFNSVFNSPFSPDNKWVAAPDLHTMRICDAHTGAVIAEPAPAKQILYPVFSPNSRYLVAAGNPSSEVWIWETKTWKRISAFSAGDGLNGIGSNGLAFAPDSKRLAITVPPGVDIWDAATNRSARAFAVPGRVEQGSYSPDGRFLLTICNNGAQQIWDMTTRTLAGNFRGSPTGISPDSTRMVVSWGGPEEIDSFPALVPLAKVQDYGFKAWLPDSQSFISQNWRFHDPAIPDPPISLFHRRRPEALYGLLWLPQCWLTLALAAAVLCSIIRDLKSWRRSPPQPTYITPWRP